MVRFEAFRQLSKGELEERARHFYPKLEQTAHWTQLHWERFNRRLFDVSELMRNIQMVYAKWHNRRYGRRGSFWEGRFKSSLVQSENYLLQCYRYIELNPVRAKMVNDPSEYAWSSYGCNGLGIKTELCTPHEEYLKLGESKDKRLLTYRDLFKVHLDGELLDQIRGSVNKGLALGNDHFKDEVETQYGQRVRPAKMGRPKKSLI